VPPEYVNKFQTDHKNASHTCTCHTMYFNEKICGRESRKIQVVKATVALISSAASLTNLPCALCFLCKSLKEAKASCILSGVNV
jgi:hypothetical protein